MPQRFLCALAFTLTLATNLNPMTRDDDHHDGSKLTLPRFDPKDPTYFDDLQAYAQCGCAEHERKQGHIQRSRNREAATL